MIVQLNNKYIKKIQNLYDDLEISRGVDAV